MVHRLLEAIRLPAIILVLVAAPLALPPVAAAKNTRVSISNYAWSNKSVHVDLGEKVTWDWIGPDLAHSVTGISDNDKQWDSDPNTDAPDHKLGDSYTLQFTSPGTYQFQCKLHAVVRGEVIVSDVPGDPDSDPGPQAPLNLDVTPPTLSSISLARRHLGRRGKGTGMTAAISERGKLDAEYYRLSRKGKRKYSGYKVWKTHVGYNHIRFGARWKHFKARPGRYVAVMRATDRSANVSKTRSKHFRIKPWPPKKRHHRNHRGHKRHRSNR